MAGIWGMTEMLASDDPGTDLAGAEHCSFSIPSRWAGAAHAAQAADGLTRSQPASQPLHHSPRENCEDVKQKNSQPTCRVYEHARTTRQRTPVFPRTGSVHIDAEQLHVLNDPSTLTSEWIHKIIFTRYASLLYCSTL